TSIFDGTGSPRNMRLSGRICTPMMQRHDLRHSTKRPPRYQKSRRRSQRVADVSRIGSGTSSSSIIPSVRRDSDSTSKEEPRLSSNSEASAQAATATPATPEEVDGSRGPQGSQGAT